MFSTNLILAVAAAATATEAGLTIIKSQKMPLHFRTSSWSCSEVVLGGGCGFGLFRGIGKSIPSKTRSSCPSRLRYNIGPAVACLRARVCAWQAVLPLTFCFQMIILWCFGFQPRSARGAFLCRGSALGCVAGMRWDAMRHDFVKLCLV